MLPAWTIVVFRLWFGPVLLECQALVGAELEMVSCVEVPGDV